MRTHRRTILATGLVAILTIAGITAAIANDPPPRIAFLANGIVPADALAAGPIAGQLGAPIFTTGPDALIDSTADALDDYNPELVIVMGGPVAISDAVLDQVSAVTGLSVVDPTPPPASGIVRAAGADRFQTAAAVATLLAAYAPAYLPIDMKAADSDLLDGQDSSTFLTETYELTNPSNNTLTGATSSGTAETIATLDLPAGTYALAGQVGANRLGTDASRTICRVTADGTTVATAIASIGADPGYTTQATLGLAGTVELAAPGTLALVCWTENLSGDAPFIGSSTTRVVATRMNG